MPGCLGGSCSAAGGPGWSSASEGQGNWIRSRLLCEGVSFFGIQFLDQRAHCAANSVCAWGCLPPVAGEGVLELLLRLYALRTTEEGFELSSVARHPGACLAALGDLASAGWLDDADDRREAAFCPGFCSRWLPDLRRSGAWTPEADRQLLARADTPLPGATAALGVRLRLGRRFLARVRPFADRATRRRTTRGSTLPRHAARRKCDSAILARCAGNRRPAANLNFCESSGFVSPQADLVGRLEGTDLGTTVRFPTAEPELLVGVDSSDLAVLARDFAVRWLAARPLGRGEHGTGAADPAGHPLPGPQRDGGRRRARAGRRRDRRRGRTRRNPRTLARHPDSARDPRLPSGRRRSGIAPGAGRTAQRVHVAPLGTPCNGEHCTGLFPLDPVEARRALHAAFADVQHHSVRVLSEAARFLRAEIARPVARVDRCTSASGPKNLPWNGRAPALGVLP